MLRLLHLQLFIISMMTLKQFNVKHAQRWLQRLKAQNLQSYKDVIKFLRKYQKTEDQYDCYLKLSHTLLSHIDLTKELNSFLEDGNRFVINRPEEEKLREFMNYVQKAKPDVFNKIISMIQNLNKTKGDQSSHDVSKMILPLLRDIISGDQALERRMNEAFQIPDEELIKQKDLQHLKVNRPFLTIPGYPRDDQHSQSNVPKGVKVNQESRTQFLSVPDKKQKVKTICLPGNINGVVQERLALKQLQKSIERKQYKFIVKIVKLYTINILTKRQALSLIHNIGLEQVHLYNLKQVMETRELDRRKQSWYKPLGDINFSNAERASPSYVTLPFFYPVICSGKTPEIRAVTNDKWLSVPLGSQQSQNFSVRNKNTNQINLLKAEDERYELDLYMKKVKTAKELFQRFLDEGNGLSQFQRGRTLGKAIELGIIQLLYKNCKDEQKEDFQYFFRNYTQETCRLFRSRLEHQLRQLKIIHDAHVAKSWNEVAVKNFYKALDLKEFQFKRNEKEKIKSGFFTQEMNERNKILANGGQIKQTTLSFFEKKDFFSILNSFQSSSKRQRCTSRKLPETQQFDLKNEDKRHLYPIMIMAFEDQKICSILYSMIIFYMDNSPYTDLEKTKYRGFIDGFLMGYLGWAQPVRKGLTEKFSEEAFMFKLNHRNTEYNPADYLRSEPETSKPPSNKKTQEQRGKKNMMILDDVESDNAYLPRASDKKKILYVSQHSYCVCRFLYVIYQRLIKIREVSDNQNMQIFELLFYSSIKNKQSIRFQQNLTALFGKSAYMFSAIYKQFDGLTRSIGLSSNCILTNYSLKLMEMNKCEEHELLLVNRFILQNNLTSSKIVRLCHDKEGKVVYFNYFDSYYRSDQIGKDMNKKRSDLSRGVQRYTVDNFRTGGGSKVSRCFQRNEVEYLFQITSFKMTNLHQSEDLLVQKQRSNSQEDKTKKLLVELNRAKVINRIIH